MPYKIFWIIARLVVVAANVAGAISTPNGNINADWRVGLLAGVLASAAFSIWLPAFRNKFHVDLTDPYSLEKPFFPINKYPIRSWLLMAFSCSLAGTVGLIMEFSGGYVNGPLPGIFLGIGLPLLVTLAIWSKVIVASD